MAATLFALAFAGAASAAPSLSLTWTSTSGTGTTGGSSIDVQPGDVVRLLVSVESGTDGFSFSSVSLSWGANVQQSAIVGNGTSGFGECPSPENGGTGFFGTPICNTDGGLNAPTFTPFASGVTQGAGFASSFDAGGTTPALGVHTIYLGALEFTVGFSETIVVDYSLAPGVDSTNNATGGVFFPIASASVVVPEPGTAALLGLGLGALGFMGRRRS